MIKNTLIGLSFAAAIASLTISLIELDRKPVFIDLGTVYQEFLLARELQKDLEKVYQARQEVLDTLQRSISALKHEIKAQKKVSDRNLQDLKDLENEFFHREEQFQKENQITANDYNTKIMKQLNEYVAEFGRKNNCAILLGANGQGNIMYADDSRDVTREVTDFINSRYSGNGH